MHVSRSCLPLFSFAMLLSCAGARPVAAPPSGVVPCVALAPSPPAIPTPASAAFDPLPWLEDLHALLVEMSSHYANLDWAVNERRMDLPALKSKTETRIREARNDDDARRAFESFLDAFGDGHLDIDWTKASERQAAEGTEGKRPLCERLGYGAQPPRPGVDFGLAGSFTGVVDADSLDFMGGVIRLPNGVKLGTIRIGLFSEKIHPALCEAARKDLAISDDAACDEECQDHLRKSVWDRMTAALERRAHSLVSAGVSGVVVDITGNGGGDDWVEPAARVLTRTPLKAPRMGFVRHEHWVKQLKEGISDLEADRAKRHDAILDAAERTLRTALEEASTPCDTSSLWEADKPRPGCSQLVVGRFFTSGILPYAKRGMFEGWKSETELFFPNRFSFHEGALALPLLVLVDGNTASASEQFSAMLRDNHAALIVGTRTVGSGCGHTNGGIRATLPRSSAHVEMPDCVRLRADGTNEVSGIVPDVLVGIGWRDSPYQRARKLMAGIAEAWPRAAGRLPQVGLAN